MIYINGEIYIIKNKINKKVYIGQTIQGSDKRFKQHLKLSKSNENQLIYKAIKKYGKENFYYEVLYTNINSYEELNKLEEEMIEKYNSLMPNGYNMCPGGQKYRRKNIEFTENEIKDIINKYNCGYSSRKIGKEYGVCYSIIIKLLRMNNIEIRDKSCSLPNRNLKINKDILYDLYINKHMTIKDISKKFNCCSKTISRALKRYNIKNIMP